MTRATYNTDNTITELPGPKPDRNNYFDAGAFDESPTFDTQKYNKALEEYGKSLRSLRTLVCSPECRGLWKPGQEVAEGKDYEVKECRTWTQRDGKWGCAECCWGDRCDEDCDATYRRPNCPFCKGSGWFKEQPLFAFPLPVKSEDGWLTTKPDFTEECILITASKVRDKWNYNFWLIEKLDNMEGEWYWGLLCPDGDEWGDLADLEADKYLVIPKLTH